jgi:hypothetical protein
MDKHKRLGTLAAGLAASATEVWKFLVESMWLQFAIDAKTYRPERYYMRGPGPKWREKHSHQGANDGSFYR